MSFTVYIPIVILGSKVDRIMYNNLIQLSVFNSSSIVSFIQNLVLSNQFVFALPLGRRVTLNYFLLYRHLSVFIIIPTCAMYDIFLFFTDLSVYLSTHIP